MSEPRLYPRAEPRLVPKVAAVSSGGGDLTFEDQVKSLSEGTLSLAGFTFSDASPSIVSSAARTYQGVQVVMRNSATATINDLAQSACWTIALGATYNLTDRPHIITVLERMMSVYPSLASVYAVFTDNGDAKAITGNGFGVEIGWPSTTFRRVGYLARAGGVWSRTVNATGVDGTHFGADMHIRPHTHTDVAQGRVYPRAANGRRSSVPGNNAQGSTAQIEGRMTHFHFGVMWNSLAGATPTLTFDPLYWIGEEVQAA